MKGSGGWEGVCGWEGGIRVGIVLFWRQKKLKTPQIDALSEWNEGNEGLN
jgi:hypothetical protein